LRVPGATPPKIVLRLPNARAVSDEVESVVKSLRAEAVGNMSVSGAGLAASLSLVGGA
jgi:hypothetical protein